MIEINMVIGANIFAQEFIINDGTMLDKKRVVTNSSEAMGKDSGKVSADIVYIINPALFHYDSLKIDTDTISDRDTVLIYLSELYKHINITLIDSGAAAASGGLNDSIKILFKDSATGSFYAPPVKNIATGEGTDSNHTGYKAEFVDDNPLGVEHLSSFSNGVIAGKLLKIKEQRAGTWWDARYAAQQTATASTANSGYGIINVSNAIAFVGSIPDAIPDPTPPDPPVPEIGIVSLTASRDRDNITLSFSADNAVTYNIYRDGVFLTTTEDTEYMDTPDRSINGISYYVTAGEQVSNTVSFNYRRYSKIIFKNL